MKKYKCKVSLNQCTNANKYALTEYEKSISEHYSMLRSYGKAILDSNPESIVKFGVTMNPDGKTYFNRFYVCFAGLTDGWKAGCRKIIALDGCFLKSLNQASKTSYPQLFNKIIDKIKSANLNAHKYLMDKNPKTWSRAIFKVDIGCEAIKNGFSECFNSVIVNVRHKTLLTMLEALEFTLITNHYKFWHVILAGENLYEVRSGSEGFIVDEVEQTPKPKGVVGRPRKKQPVDDFKDVDVVQRGPVRDEGASGTRGGAIGSRGRGGAVGSRGGASGSIGRGAGGSRGRGVGGSKRKLVSTVGT
ncbi:hypothetical protein Tco_0536701 [Tanacetum coccineum]